MVPRCPFIGYLWDPALDLQEPQLVVKRGMTQPKATNRHGVKPQTVDGSVREHVLLTVLGTDPQPACYVLDDLQAEATMAPIALVELLPEEECPDRVLALCTPEARRDSLPLLEQSLAARCPAAAVDVPRGETQEETSAFVTTLARCVPKDVDLTVDVTHGYRHFAFLMYVAVLYLAPLRGVKIRRACYGMLNRMPEPSPFLDLGPLLDLPRWVHALKVLDETGSALPLARLLDSGSASGPAKTIARDLGRLSEAYLSGLPLELGRQAQIVRQCHPKPLRKLLRNAHRVPLADDLVGRLDEILRGFDPAGSLPSGPGWKGNVAASESELRRQARVIDDLLQRELFATALGLMNEWTVSWVAWVRGKGEEWLDYRKVRTSAAALLGAMCAAQKSELRHLLTEDLCRLGSFWGQLGELRNGYAHHGMRPQVLVGDTETDKKRRRIITYWEGNTAIAAQLLPARPASRSDSGESHRTAARGPVQRPASVPSGSGRTRPRVVPRHMFSRDRSDDRGGAETGRLRRRLRTPGRRGPPRRRRGGDRAAGNGGTRAPFRRDRSVRERHGRDHADGPHR